MGAFRFKQFEVRQDRAALKVGTDAVLLGALMTLPRDGGSLLDIGTGTGVIALMAAQRMAASSAGNWDVTGIDIDGPSIGDAFENFDSSPWKDRLEAVHSSLEDFGRTGAARHYETIFSNPPYYDNSLLNPDAREAGARHTDSLSYREILAFAAERLSGTLSLILPSEEEQRLLRTAASFGLFPFRKVRIRTVDTKDPRRTVVEFRKGDRRGGTCTEEELILQHNGQRTEAYTDLCKDFYL